MYTSRNISQKEKNTILHFTITRTEIQGVMLSEVYQKENDKYQLISCICEL